MKILLLFILIGANLPDFAFATIHISINRAEELRNHIHRVIEKFNEQDSENNGNFQIENLEQIATFFEDIFRNLSIPQGFQDEIIRALSPGSFQEIIACLNRRTTLNNDSLGRADQGSNLNTSPSMDHSFPRILDPVLPVLAQIVDAPQTLPQTVTVDDESQTTVYNNLLRRFPAVRTWTSSSQVDPTIDFSFPRSFE
jgi:hypothetical protein